MDQSDGDPLLSASLLAKIESVAIVENRSSRDVLQEAVEQFLQRRRPSKPELSKARAAAERMLASRHEHKLPEGETIRSLMTFGRM